MTKYAIKSINNISGEITIFGMSQLSEQKQTWPFRVMPTGPLLGSANFAPGQSIFEEMTMKWSMIKTSVTNKMVKAPAQPAQKKQ